MVSTSFTAAIPARAKADFVPRHSIVRTIWGNPDLVLLIFAGSAAEFALNRAVDWLFFTGEIPRDPIGRLFSTVRYAQEIVFGKEEQARQTLDRINSQHASVERQRRETIPDWAYRDVLYMLIDYSQRAYALLYEPLSQAQKSELFEVFLRIGEALHIPELPQSYAEWKLDRRQHIVRDLKNSKHTAMLFQSYRRDLGAWRYWLLLEVQGVLVPKEVRRLLQLPSNPLLSVAAQTYGIVGRRHVRSMVHKLLIPPRYWTDVRKFARR
jgi:uncharacterized protein (DUF2236 family)